MLEYNRNNHIEGVYEHKNNIIKTYGGNVGHIINSKENDFHGFGELYFTTIDHEIVRGWKKHNKMILNLVVLSGSVEITLLDKREKSKTKNMFNKILLSEKENKRLTVPNNIWFAFKGISKFTSKMINFSNIIYDDSEISRLNINEFKIQL